MRYPAAVKKFKNATITSLERDFRILYWTVSKSYIFCGKITK